MGDQDRRLSFALINPAGKCAVAYDELVLKWLQKNTSNVDSLSAMDAAAQGGHLPVLQWLFENCADCEAADLQTVLRSPDEITDLSQEKKKYRLLRWIARGSTRIV